MDERNRQINVKPKLVEYINYRRFLSDYYETKKGESPNFSYRSFARLAGFSSSSYLHHVISGRRKISSGSIEGFCKALGLSQKEKIYFENLVRFNQTNNADAKKHYYEQLLPIYKKETGKKLKTRQYQFYSNWYGPVIREMVNLKDFNESPEWISRRLKNLITPAEAGKMLELLIDLELVSRDETGRLKATDKNLTTPVEVKEMAVTAFHQEMLNQAKDSLKEDSGEEREISCITSCLTKDQFNHIKQLTQEFQNKIMLYLENSGRGEDEVYQFNCQLFPLTKKREGKNGK